ncbi:type II secretion system minor pseudopilin GspJ [Rheinheimera sp. WS51]|uniref:type II secretion system minor pseudopilin GspJ n=1 Tax=Rheinheimera sp. WS51 TaxID=3425886 RepID=UPI003D8F1A10
MLKYRRGFTFIEMLLAIAIFALVGLASISVLTSVSKSDELSRESGQRLIEIQRTMLMLERDFMQISARHVRINGEAAEKNRLVGEQYLLNSEDHGISFSRQGWRNPGMILPRSELQAVAYRLQEGSLQRLFTLYPDAVTGTEPRVQVLQTDLTGFEIEYFNGDKWLKRWQDSMMPSAIKVILVHTYLGQIERIFMLPDGLTAEAARSE